MIVVVSFTVMDIRGGIDNLSRILYALIEFFVCNELFLLSRLW